MTEKFQDQLQPQFYTSIPCIPLSIMTISLDLFVINYYRKSKLTLVSLLYTFISIVDIATAIGILHQSLSVMLFTQGSISLSTLDSNAYIFNPMFQLSYRTSVFYNLVLSVSRTVIMLQPFYRIKIKTVAVVCVLYLVIWIMIAGIDAYVFYLLQSAGLLGNISTIVLLYPTLNLGFGLSTFLGLSLFGTLAINIFSLLVPALIITLTCMIQVIILYRSRNVTSSVTNQRHVTITVVMMSTLFVICNSCLYLWYVYLMIAVGDEYSIKMFTSAALYGILGTVFPILNAAINPVIIISRSNGLRDSFIKTFPVFKKRIPQRRVNFEMTERPAID